MLPSPRVLPALAAATLLAAAAVSQAPSFAQDVLPILSDRCFQCHGPDAGARKADLRLDLRAGAMSVVVAGDPDGSELIRRVTAADPAERMPPAESKLALDADEIAVLRRWVESGAEWEGHWAFTAPAEPPLPAVDDAAWPRGDLDRFVLARLESAGRRPSPPADAASLLRRVTLDLTGLPPAPAELDAFVADPSDAAYERVVDRLLASPRYGERMAWPWLEAARYADTDGYQNDPTRAQWPWRDWLVRALNDNVPFDRLTAEMLAGDLLPDAGPEQVLASGFCRNNAHNGEGGRIPAETRVENVFDRSETAATVWMGLTFECARCHDHKFDPITQRDYYRLFSFFDQTSETGAGNNGRSPPTLRYLDAAARTRVAELTRRAVDSERRMAAPDPELDAAQADWMAAERDRLSAVMAEWRPVRLGPWSVLGPLAPEGGDGGSLFDTEFGPERGAEVDGWREDLALVDGQTHALGDGVWAIYLRRTIQADSDRELELSFGSDDAIRVWCNGDEVLTRNVRRGVAPDQDRATVAVAAGANELLVKIVNTGGRGGVYFRKVGENVEGLPSEIARALLVPAAERDEATTARLREHYRSRHWEQWRVLAKIVEDATAERRRVESEAPQVLVMDELPADRRRTTRVLERGTYDQPRDAVSAGTPAFLPEMPADAARDRLGLARWLVSGEHPLTARVAVNRAWQLFFGRGLVKTSEDFGRQGSRPTHPGLLDWLARRYVESGWDTKALHRLIVTSATYRQSSHATPRDFAADPDNAALARASRFRLPAWMLRDQALVLGGWLVDRVGGPPVRPYQPDGVWAEATFDQIRYRREVGEALHRRSVYVFWRRIVGPTFLFDTPGRQACVVRGSSTNSPLHALTTLNETAFVEAARGLAERACRHGDDPRARIAWAFRAATSRRADAAELSLLVARWRSTRERFAHDPAAAAALLAVGDCAWDRRLPAADLAAYTVVASVLLNLDEVLTRP